MPVWANSPEGCLKRGSIPIDLLIPTVSTIIDKWINDATACDLPNRNSPIYADLLEAYYNKKEILRNEIIQLRERVAYFNLPFLALPSSTEKSTALQVFVNMNTNSKALSLYDIIVAEIEQTTETSLHDLQQILDETNPKIKRYGDLSHLILTTSALLQDCLPNNRGMSDMKKPLMVDKWKVMERCLARMASFLESQGIFDEQRLPTNAVLAVIAASYAYIPENGDFLGKAEKLLRRYLWSSFFTERYQNSAASRAYADYIALIKLLKNPDFVESSVIDVPVLNREDFPIIEFEKLIKLGWPKKAGISERGLLAISTHLGAIDFADEQQASYESIQRREYHHIFPDALLKEVEIESYLSLNCALITWKTNRDIGRKDPLKYIEERTAWMEENTIRRRLRSHLISYDLLAKGGYEELDKKELTVKLKADFDSFLNDRAKYFYKAIELLTCGNTITVDMLMPHNL